MVLIAQELQQLKELFLDLHEKGKKAGLNINLNKTKILSRTETQDVIEIENVPIETKEEIVYLGQLIT